MENYIAVDGITLNLDDYESIFDAVSEVRRLKEPVKHSLLDVVELPIVDDKGFKVKDLKDETLNLESGSFKYLSVSNYSNEKKRYLRIDKSLNNAIVFSNVNLIGNNEEDKVKLYEFSLNEEPSWLNMYIEILYEIKNY